MPSQVPSVWLDPTPEVQFQKSQRLAETGNPLDEIRSCFLESPSQTLPRGPGCKSNPFPHRVQEPKGQPTRQQQRAASYSWDISQNQGSALSLPVCAQRQGVTTPEHLWAPAPNL